MEVFSVGPKSWRNRFNAINEMFQNFGGEPVALAALVVFTLFRVSSRFIYYFAPSYDKQNFLTNDWIGSSQRCHSLIISQ